ncbi:MAG: hypothetical protein J6J93_10070 [Muribaculaceae bacterium]|nr:hypothetical protein [Muribaculaceae bacterium]
MKKLYTFLTLAACTAAASALTPVQRTCSLSEISAPTRLATPAKHALKAPDTKEASGTWTDWAPAGTCTYTIDTGLIDFGTGADYSGSHEGVKLDYREDTGDANICQYRLNGVYNDVNIVVDYDKSTGAVHVFPQATGYNCYEEFPMQVLDAGTAFREIAMDEEMAATFDAYNYYIEPLGRFYIYLGYTFDGLGDLCALTDATIQIDGFPDFTPELVFDQRYGAGSPAKGTVKVTESAESVRVAVFPGTQTQDKINAVLSNGEGVVTIPGGENEFTLPEMEANKAYMIYAVSFVGDVACEMATKFVSVVDEEKDKWTSLGQTDVTCDILESVFETIPSDMKAEIQQNKENPAVYRLVDLYKANNPNIDEDAWDALPQYVYFDLTDPDYVTVQPVDLGVNIGAGAIIVQSYYFYLVDHGKTEEKAKEMASGGKYDATSHIVTFDDNSLVLAADDWTPVEGEKGAIYGANLSGKMQFAIPTGTTGVDNIAVDANAPRRLYDLRGAEVTGKAAPGIYIEKRGTVARKVIIR